MKCWRHAHRTEQADGVEPSRPVLYTGRFVDRKGIRELLEAAAIVLDRSPRVRFVLAGGHRGCTGEDMSRYWMPPICEPFRDRITFNRLVHRGSPR
jgi:hypothetical protein